MTAEQIQIYLADLIARVKWEATIDKMFAELDRLKE